MEKKAEPPTAVLQDGEISCKITITFRKKQLTNYKPSAYEIRHLAKPQDVMAYSSVEKKQTTPIRHLAEKNNTTFSSDYLKKIK